MTDDGITDVGTDKLIELGDSDLAVADPREDIRGRDVLDRDGNEIGQVDELLVDDREGKVRFLRVASGGFLGLGERMFLLPVAAVTRIADDRVYVDQTRERIAGAPAYDPALVDDPGYLGRLYGHYGYDPHWSLGYAYPPYPDYP